MSKSATAIVVGAGLGGPSAALTLARIDREVVVLGQAEQSRASRDARACGRCGRSGES
jgi:2-polyprenyl-6-methoxyphenol hydroxylase-like FAD-dependent oxidoreductase